jgi:hypothetical protein
MLGLSLGLPFKYDTSAGDPDPWYTLLLGDSGGASAGYAPGQQYTPILGGIYTSVEHAGYVNVRPGTRGGLTDEAVIVHELGHRFDHIAGSPERYWSTGAGWTAAAGWLSEVCAIDGDTTFALTPTGRAGAVSEYAARYMYGVFAVAAQRYYRKHTKALVQDGWTEADFVNAATHLNGRLRPGGNPSEDFAETFAWYVYNETRGKQGFSDKPYGLSGGIENSRNKQTGGAPDKARLDALVLTFLRDTCDSPPIILSCS